MKSAPIFVSGALLLSACLFWPDDEPENPFIGQWKSSYEVVETFRDSLKFDQLRDLLDSRGYDPLVNWPPPQELLDSFSTAFSCIAAVCDSVLWVRKEFLVFTGDAFTYLILRNGALIEANTWAYTFDNDSLYQTDSILDEAVTLSSHYSFSGNRDTVNIGYEVFAEGDNVWARNSDPLPSY